MAQERGCTVDKSLLLAYLDGRRRPIGVDPNASERDRALFAQAPELYLDLLADPAAHVSQRREVLVNLLGEPTGERVDREAMLERLRAQPVEEALSILEGIRCSRRSGRRARSLGLSFLLAHDRLAELASSRRTRLVRLLKHLLGERTWSSAVRCLCTGAPGALVRPKQSGFLPAALLERLLGGQRPEHKQVTDPELFLRRTLLRFAKSPAVAREALRVVAGDVFEPVDPFLARRMAARRDLQQGANLPRETLFGLRGTFHGHVPAARVRFMMAAPAVRDLSPRDGPLTALFKQSLDPTSEPLTPDVVSEQVKEVTAGVPAVDAAVALVLDLSGSAAASGERANHPAALGLALLAVLRDRVREVRLMQVGGSKPLDHSVVARPEGATDLAAAVVAAARERPDAIMICTDGYENVRQGDTASLVAGLRRLGLGLPIFQVVPLFASGEDLSRRALADEIPVLTIRHEMDFGELLARVSLANAPADLLGDDLHRVRRLLLGSFQT
jgi:hypothetical protein